MGRDIHIDGELSLSVFPNISIKVGKASLSNPKNFGTSNFASINNADISVKFLPLLQQKLRVNSVNLHGLNLKLHRSKDGHSNWEDLLSNQPNTSEESDFAEVISKMIAGLTVSGVSVTNSQIHWRDDVTGQRIDLSPITLKTGAYKADKPLDVSLDTQLTQNTPAMKLKLKASTRLKLNKDKQTFSLRHLKLNSLLSGDLAKGGVIASTLAGDVSGDANSIYIPMLNLSSDISGGYAPKGKIKLSLSGKTSFKIKQQKLTISGMTLDSTVTGKLIKNGTLTAHITGNTDFDIKKQLLNLAAMQSQVHLKNGALGSGSLNATIAANTHFNITKQSLKLSNMKGNVQLKNGVLGNGSLNAGISSDTHYNLATQVINLRDMQSNIQMQGGVLAEGKLNTQVLGNTKLNLQDSSLSIDNLTLSSTVNSSIIPDGSLKQTAQGSVALNWASNDIDANLSSLLIKLAKLQLSGSARISQQLTAPEIKGSFQTNTFNLSEVLKTIGITPPKTKKAGLLGSTQMDFSIVASPNKADLSTLSIKLDDSHIVGNVSIQNFAKPRIRGKLNIDRLNIDNYLSPEIENKAPTPAAAALLPLAVMRNLDLDASLAIGSLVYSKIKMSKASVKLNASNGIVKADPISAKLYKGKYEGSIHLDTAKASPSISMKHKLRGLRSEGLLYDLFQDKLVTGSADLTSDIHTSGNSVTAVKKNLAGTINVIFRDGTIRDSNFAKKTEIAVKAFEEKKTDGSGKTEVKFTKLSGDWTIKHGIFSTDSMAMKAPQFRIKGSGDVDIVKEELDFKLNIGRKKIKDQRDIFIPFRIYGAFDHLKYQLRLDELLKQLAKEDVEKAKKKAKEQLRQEEEKLKARLEAQKQAEIDKLKAKRDEAKQRLQKQADQAKADAKAKLEREKQRLQEDLKKKVGEKLGEDIGKQLEDKLKDKLKGLF